MGKKGEATRGRILDAASNLIHSQGYNATSVDDILREASLSKGNFYFYFRSKEELGLAVIDYMFEVRKVPSLQAAMGAAPDESTTREAALHRCTLYRHGYPETGLSRDHRRRPRKPDL